MHWLIDRGFWAGGHDLSSPLIFTETVQKAPYAHVSIMSVHWVPAALIVGLCEGRSIMPPLVDEDTALLIILFIYSQIFIEDLLCARHRSRLWQYNSEKNEEIPAREELPV